MATSARTRLSLGQLLSPARPRVSTLEATISTIKSCIFFFSNFMNVSRGIDQSFFFFMPTLLVFLQLKPESPFKSHPCSMGIAVFSSCTYYLARVVHERCSLHRVASSLSLHVTAVIGDIAVVSVMSIFFPDWTRPILYLVFGLTSAGVLLRAFFVGRRFTVQKRSRVRRFFKDLGNWFCSSERAHVLPR